MQHAVCKVIAPIFERGLLPNTFACRPGLGTHAGVRHVQAALRHFQPRYFLKTDYSKFFPSVDRAVLHELIERKIDCAGTLAASTCPVRSVMRPRLACSSKVRW